MAGRDEILKRIKEIILEIEPDARIILYGSRARGNPHPESDWDIVILLNKDIVSKETENSISDNLFDLELETGEVISPMVYTIKDWNSKYRVTPFYYNVTKDGILI